MMKRIFLILLVLTGLQLSAADRSDSQNLYRMIGRMLIVGFDAQTLEPSDPFAKAIRRYRPGGVILFDRDFHDRNRTKNIASPQQLKTLTSQLQALSPSPILIAVDQEGGSVQRLKPRDGFIDTPSAKSIGDRNDSEYAKQVYDTLANEIENEGINADFAPVVDLALNQKNHVIYGLKRAYGKSPQKVAHFAGIFANALHAHNIISVLKHFPGHGSSREDSHRGFVDVTHTWSAVELEPYKILIESGRAEMIMTAHVFNRNLDPDYPATLSKKTNTGLLRGTLGFKGVIVSDDLQMRAISGHYSLRETVRLAINAGVDMLLFGNQLGHTSLKEAADAVYAEVKAGHISRERIAESNRRIEKLFNKYRIGDPKIIDRPIDFGPERIALTKRYIKQHYGKTVGEITIDPKIIVLHWTAEMDTDRSFELLKPELLRGARTDIASAGALNVSAHFLVARDGTIYRLMPENWMARHVIGLNYNSIGIENVGGENNEKEDLTPAQVRANIMLIRYLKRKFPDIEYLIGHYDYRKMEKSKLWLERDSGYRTEKSDPGPHFMHEVRAAVSDLDLKAP